MVAGQICIWVAAAVVLLCLQLLEIVMWSWIGTLAVYGILNVMIFMALVVLSVDRKMAREKGMQKGVGL